MRLRLPWVGLLLVLGVLVSAPTSTAAVRWDEVGPSFWGNLTWTPSGGRIVWGPNPTTMDDQPASASPSDVDALQNGLGEPFGTAPPEPDVFTSDPLPRTLVLNVTRSIQLELNLKDHPKNPTPCGQVTVVPFLKNQADPQLHVELLAGGERLGGNPQAGWVNWQAVYPTRQPPTDPPGYGTCRFAMHPELVLLPAGSVLTLRIERVEQIYSYPIGLQGDHQSRIRLALLPAEEVAYRYPDLFGPGDDLEEGLGPGASAAAPLFVLGLVAARADRRALVALGLVAAGLLAGCLQSSGPAAAPTASELEGRVENTLVPDVQGELTSKDRGIILGLIHDDLYLPVAGVHVSVLGQSQFTESNGAGRFRLNDLAPGVVRLRFDHKDYRSFETDVEVRSGFVSRPTIELALLNPKERDFRQHSHNYWGTDDAKEIYTKQFQETCTGTGGTQCTFPSEFLIEEKAGEIRSILPGTQEVEVTLTWADGTAHPDRYGFSVQTNWEPKWANQSYFAARPSGVPFRIQTTWGMTDVGHQPFSQWRFFFAPLSGAPSIVQSSVDANDPSHHYAPLTVKIVVHRGALPLEPPHKAYWGAGDVMRVLKDTPGDYLDSQNPPGAPQACDCSAGTPGVTIFYGTTSRRYPMLARPTEIVPSGTKWVEFKLVQSRPSNPHFDWELHYKTGNMRPLTGIQIEWGLAYPSMLPTAVSADGRTSTWRIPVGELDADPEYAPQTTWDFVVVAADETAKYLDYHSHGEMVIDDRVPLDRMTITMSAFAHRDPLPS